MRRIDPGSTTGPRSPGCPDSPACCIRGPELLPVQLRLPASFISTPRLELWPMTTAFLEACLHAGRNALEAAPELNVPPDWLKETDLMELRLAEFQDDPAYAAWGLRAVRIAGSGTM